MKAKVPKCHSLAIYVTSGRAFDPKLMLQGASAPRIWDEPVKFLGTFLQVPLDQQRVRKKPFTEQAAHTAGESRLNTSDPQPETPSLQGWYMPTAQLGSRNLRPPHLLGQQVPGDNGNMLPKELVRPQLIHCALPSQEEGRNGHTDYHNDVQEDDDQHCLPASYVT